MKKLLLLFAFAGLLSCRSDNQVQPFKSKELGQYLVTAYIVGGDTLFATSAVSTWQGQKPGPNINKVGISSFRIIRERTDENHELLTYSYYRDDLTPKLTRAVKPYVLSDYLTGYSLLKDEVGTSYEGRLRNSTNVFTERTVGGGLFIPLKGQTGSPNPTFTDKEVVIVAMPVR